MTRPMIVLALLAALTACESGLSEFHVITVDDAVATGFSVDAPGLLRTEGGFPLVTVLCGEALAEPAELSIDYGFGCLEEGQKGTEEQRVAWIEPMPVSWDAAALCAMEPPEPAWHGMQPREDVTGGPESYLMDLAEAPEPGWDQAIGVGAWRRSLTPCGGSLRVEIEIGPDAP